MIIAPIIRSLIWKDSLPHLNFSPSVKRQSTCELVIIILKAAESWFECTIHRTLQRAQKRIPNRTLRAWFQQIEIDSQAFPKDLRTTLYPGTAKFNSAWEIMTNWHINYSFCVRLCASRWKPQSEKPIENGQKSRLLSLNSLSDRPEQKHTFKVNSHEDWASSSRGSRQTPSVALLLFGHQALRCRRSGIE